MRYQTLVDGPLTCTPIAKSGASGRVTGPHLHFAVRWQGLYLEPSTLLGLWSA